MKKLFTFLLALIASVGIASAQNGTCGDNLTWEFDAETGILTISGTGAMADYPSASSVPWYEYRSSFQSVIITDSVTSIGRQAFESCSSLTSVTIPNSVTSIGDYAFMYCSSLTSITIPNSVTSIGRGAFSGCSSVTSVTIGNSVTSIGRSAFDNCSSLTSVTIPNSVTSIGNYAFYSVSNIVYHGTATGSPWGAKSVNGYVENNLVYADETKKILLACFTSAQGEIIIPNTVTSIGDRAFYGCSSLTSVTIPNSVTSIGEGAFSGCSSLTSVTIPNSVTSIENYTFSSCNSLTSVTIPNSVTSIGSGAFLSSSSSLITSVTFEGRTPPLMEYAFNVNDNCSIYVPCGTKEAYLTALNENNTIDESRVIEKTFTASGTCGAQGDNLTWELSCDSVLTISGTGEMQGCFTNQPWGDFSMAINRVIVEEGVTSIGNWAFPRCNSITSISLPNSLIKIEYSALSCSKLRSIIIPENVSEIGQNALKGSGLENIQVAEGNSFFCSVDGVLFNKDTTILLCYPEALQGECVIPSNVNIIGYLALSVSGITKITCNPITPPQLEKGALNDIDKSIPLYVPAESIDLYKAANQWKDFTNILPIGETPAPCITASGTCGAQGDNLTWELSCDSVLTISGTGEMADYTEVSLVPWAAYRSVIKELNLPEGLTSIGKLAFAQCDSLTSVAIPSTTSFIGYYAFQNCASLISLTLPYGVVRIGWAAFHNCPSLESVTIPNSVSSIETYSFAGCSSLTSINVDDTHRVYRSVDGILFDKNQTTLLQYPAGKIETTYEIPESVTAIGQGSFYGAANLASIDIHEGVTSIGSQAFSYCTGLVSIVLPESVTDLGQGAFFNCSSLTSANIPHGITSVNQLFSKCSNLTSVEIPNSVTDITYYAFSGCSSLTSIVIPNSVTTIGDERSFMDCHSLQSLTIGDGVVSIAKYTFINCTGLTSITCKAVLPPALGANVFYNVDKTIPLYVPCASIEAYKAADGWSEFTNIQAINPDDCGPCLIASGYCGADSTNLTWELSCDSVLTISGTGAMEDGECIDDPLGDLPIPDEDNDNSSVIVSDPVKSIIIKEGVTTIGVSAFWGRSSLTSVTIPNTVTSIGNGAFRSCTSLSSVYITDIAAWCRISTTGKDLSGMGINECELSNPFHYADNLYLNGELVTDLVIPNSVTRIEPHVFNSCSCLTSVTIGDSVNSIGDFAFAYCKGLTSVTFGNSVTSIGMQAFDGCDSLTSVTIPNSVTNIGDYAFFCSSLTSVTFEGRTPPLMEYAFYVNDNCSFYVPCGTKDAYVAALNVNNTIDESRVIEIVIASGYCGADSTNLTWELSCDSVLTISGTGAMADYAYASITPWYGHRSAIKTILINDGVTSIGDNAFYGCKSLTSVTIGNNMTRIGSSVFTDCWRLDALQLPESVTSIGNSAFAGCFRFRNIHIPKNVSSIGTRLFQYCSKLVSITVDTENPIYDSRDNCNAIIETSTNVLVEGSNATHIPETVVAIGKSAFANKNGFRQIDIPNSITSIGEDAFINCDTLESLVVPTSVSYMGRSAFYQCSGLKTVEFKSVTPPNIDNRYMGGTCFLGTTCDFLVPCGTKEAYVIALNYQSVSDSIDESRVIESEELMFDYTISSDNTLGSVTITQEPTCTAPLIFRADATEGYQFTQWSDGNTDNPRTIMLTQDTILKALFEQIIIEQDTIIVTDSTDISDIITGGQDTIPHVEVQPGGEITIDRDDIGIGVITIITIGTESGQVHPWDGGYDNLKNTRVVMEYVLNPFGQTASPDKWYAFAVPFKVDIETGVTRKYGNKSHVPGKDFMILEYDSELRAKTGSGWKEKKSGLLEPGHFYMLGIEGNCNRWLFEKVRDADVVGDKEKDLQHYAHGNSKNDGWHGLGNTTLEYVDMSFDGLNATYVYTYDNQCGKYNICSIEELKELILAVGQPFFTQGDNDGSVVFTPNNSKGKGNGKKNMPIYAPSYDVQPSHPRVLLTIETEKINATPDRLYITLHDDNQCGSYRIGRDFMRMDKGSKVLPNFWCPMADGTQLSAHGVTMPTTYTTIPLGIFTPAKGEYTINAHMQDMDDYIVELYYQNVCLGIVMQGVPFRLEMAAGTSYDYSIRISRKVSTDLNPVEDTQCDKDNKWYDVLGRPLPQDAHGIFIRKGEKIIK